jgi:hypothetical protein
VKATLIVNDAEIKCVPCKIYLPERINEKPHIILKPSAKDAKRIMSSYKGIFRASVYGFDKKVTTTIEAPEIYFSGSSIRYWGDDITDSTVPAEPQDLHIIDHLETHGEPQRTKITFWISPNRYLSPSLMQTSSYTGDLKYKRRRNMKFTIKDGVKLVFDEHFQSKTVQNGDFVQWSFLVACTELDIPADEVNTLKKFVLPDIDDFLLIASFATMQRTACLGWMALDKSSHATFYRGNYVFPQFENGSSLDKGILDVQDFEKFMQTCYSAFLRFENKLALRNALYSVLLLHPNTVETSFLHLFIGLETLILNYKRQENLESILPKSDWPSLKKYLQKCIKNSNEPKLKTEQRKSMYCKLDELNHVSLREAFDIFCKKFSVDLTDLWPVFGENRLAGLVDIRNKLVHGDPLPNNMLETLVVAKEHLIYILERMLIRVLRWNVAETKLNPDYLKTHLLVIKDMSSKQVKLSEYINQGNGA